MRFVQVQARAVFLAELLHGRKLYDVTFHAEDAVGDDKLGGVQRLLGQELLQARHVVVRVSVHPHFASHPRGKEYAVHDGGVVQLVGKYVLVSRQEGRDGPEVGLVARGEAQGPLPAHEPGQVVLQLFVQREGAVEKPRSRAARSPLFCCRDGGFFHARVPREAQVIVGTRHDELFALHDHPRSPTFLNRLEVWVNALFLCLPRLTPRVAFLKYVQGGLPLGGFWLQ